MIRKAGPPIWKDRACVRGYRDLHAYKLLLKPQLGLTLPSSSDEGGSSRRTPSPVRFFAADVGAACPALLQTCSYLLESSTALLMERRGQPGITSELMRPPITFICFKELYPAMTPHISESSHLLHVPLDNVANYKKTIAKKDKWKRPQKKIIKDYHFCNPGGLVHEPHIGSPLRLPCDLMEQNSACVLATAAAEMRDKTSLIKTNPCHFFNSSNLN
ncbi:unnamed protein product [Rangifer tarandus platyrhynchus]|uniref:Uncharacterized protein n=1 Tax=Rangifer tarandus platyrhynchus TaxID=3082113 RepID=A0ABN8YKV4_RANTA|nr:unnamed protein product [Rangifer tarandus platyrhynchus]